MPWVYMLKGHPAGIASVPLLISTRVEAEEEFNLAIYHLQN